MTTAPATGPDFPTPSLTDLEAMAQVADASMLLCERMTVAGLSLVDDFVALTSRRADAMMGGDSSLGEFWREESTLVQAWGSTLIDCAGECGNLILTTQLLLRDDGQPADAAAAAMAQRPYEAVEQAGPEIPFAAAASATVAPDKVTSGSNTAELAASHDATSSVVASYEAPTGERAAVNSNSPAAPAKAEHQKSATAAKPATTAAKRSSATAQRPTSPRKPTRPG